MMQTDRRVLAVLLCLSAVFFTGCSGSSNSGGSSTPTPTAPTPTPPAAVAPSVSSISPSSLTAGASATTLTVTGTGFLSTSTVQVGGVAEPATYVSSTQLTASVPASQLTIGAALNVIVSNGTLSSSADPAVPLTVNNPAPVIAQIAPSALLTGSMPTVINVTGTGFVPTTTIQVNGVARTTTFVSPTQVTVTLAVADLAGAGSVKIAAINTSPGGGTSAASSVAVNNPAPGPLTLTPNTVTGGATTATTITVLGSNFTPSSLVQVNGSNRSTTYVSPTQLKFQLTVADLATTGILYVAVTTPSPGGGVSAMTALTVAAPVFAPNLFQVYPSSILAGSGDTTVFVSGSNIAPSDVVQWNGIALATTVVGDSFNGYDLTAVVPANLVASAGTASITVYSPNSTPTLSNALTESIINAPAPTLTSISPSAGPINTPATINLFGTNFTAASTVTIDGSSIAPTYISPTYLTIDLPALSFKLPGIRNIAVTTPAPGGGTTAALGYTAYIGIVNNSMVYNPANGLFYVSVPSSAGAPYGNSVVSVDPETGSLGTPIFVGSEPNKLAISSDGSTLWVGLDGAGAVREVNLNAGTAGLQFSLGVNTGIYQTPTVAMALAVLPGAPNSVVVATQTSSNYDGQIAIYDSGVLRGSALSSTVNSGFDALQVNGSIQEIYAGGQAYTVYTYGPSGLTLKTTVGAAFSGGNTYATPYSDEMQIAGGNVYTDFGQAFDAEAGSLLGTFYETGSTTATGPAFADTTLGKVFILDSAQNIFYNPGLYQIQAFNLSNYTAASQSAVPITTAPSTTNNTPNIVAGPNRLTRWGTNGLAFRNASGVYSVRTNLVKDLSTTITDLSVAVTGTAATTTGSTSTYTATVSNAGPAGATNVALTAEPPSIGVLLTATPSSGSCTLGAVVSCDLGTIANGASTIVVFTVQQTTAGSATLTAQVSGSETDSSPGNNSASGTIAVTGSTYNLPPVVSSLSPSTVIAGAGDTLVTVTGTNFVQGSSVQLGSVALTTSFSSSTQLTATVPAAQLASLGWAPLTVSTPAPGGGVSNPVPLSIYSVITLDANHILYDPYSSRIMASVSSASTTVTGNSIVAITPGTATVGTPVNIGSQPTNLALTDDGRILYTILTGSESVARFNMLTQQPDFTYTVPAISNSYNGIGLAGIATQPGTENTVALDLGPYNGYGLYDFDPVAKTAAIRGQTSSGFNTGPCIQFLDAGDMLGIDSNFSYLDQYTVTPTGFAAQYTQSTQGGFGCFKLSGGLIFGNRGGVANPASVPATPLGTFPLVGSTNYAAPGPLAPDTSLQRTFFLVNIPTTAYSPYSNPTGIQGFDQRSFLPSVTIPLNIDSIEGNTTYTGLDLIRWGQDGLAALTSGGHIYLIRGAAVVPQLLHVNTAAILTSSSSSSLTHGTGNTILTLTGSNFIPGVAVTWNGSYRTTTIVSPTQLTVALPASDLAGAGTGSLIAANPGAPASGALTITIH